MASTNFQVSPAGMNNGGGTGSSPNFQVEISTGEATATGTSQSPNFGVSAGFQAAAQEEVPEEAPPSLC